MEDVACPAEGFRGRQDPAREEKPRRAKTRAARNHPRGIMPSNQRPGWRQAEGALEVFRNKTREWLRATIQTSRAITRGFDT
jgi:hypothetical protein